MPYYTKCEYFDTCKENYKDYCKQMEKLKHKHCCTIERKKDLDRQIELERVAKNKYCECIDWTEIINMLSADDQAEYYRLAKKGGFYY
ncbi:hypothetical protein LCGC14_1096560 [marine sediment metagenome]|uniref:Uncharacterized protein n=1 Tax=marine sediment metagenome TaxID=412755 RepID=A0A0F9MF65_9ZZZZ